MTKKRSQLAKAPRPRATGGSSHASQVVGVGGSAGSLEGLEAFFRAIRSGSKMAFVVVTHRDPRSSGRIMVELLARFTAMPVREATQGAVLERGAVYVVPSDQELHLRDGRIALRARPIDAGPPTAIDSLFRALAEHAEAHAFGVLLSGMGADGTVGLAAIKKGGGRTFVQDPKTAAFAPMPTSAIAAGVADFVSAPDVLAQAVDGVEGVIDARGSAAVRPQVGIVGPAEILALVHARTGQDFSHYKKNTMARRIERRRLLHRAPDAAAYLRLLEQDEAEMSALFTDLLVNVTRFFRDPELWSALGTIALAELGERHPAERPLRAWVAGCSTGEEAYSLAIVIREYWEKRRPQQSWHVQIYATDLDPDAIVRARAGWYPRIIETDVSSERLARFFAQEGAGYRIKKDVRDMVVFATHNVTSDPPFTKLDILACRNLLIYLDVEMQGRVLPLLAHALSPGGILVLGRPEELGVLADSFAPIARGLEIYRRRPALAGAVRREPLVKLPAAARPARNQPLLPQRQGVPATTLPEDIQRAVIDKVAPPVVVIDAKGNLLFASQRPGKFFELPAGKATINVFEMAREGLALALRTAVRSAIAKNTLVTERGVRTHSNRRLALLDVSVWPLAETALPARAMIAITEVEPPVRVGRTRVSDHAALVELRRVKGHVDALMAEMSVAQDALQVVNEELQSTNEELQSTNEELTTSKEEMQSMNEELHSLNAERQSKNDQLAMTNGDMRNLLDSTQIPTLFLGNDLCLKRYNAQSGRVVHLIPADVGSPISDLALTLHYTTLSADVQTVLRTLVDQERQVEAHDGSTYTMRIHPYRTMDDRLDGVVVTFMDVTALLVGTMNVTRGLSSAGEV